MNKSAFAQVHTINNGTNTSGDATFLEPDRGSMRRGLTIILGEQPSSTVTVTMTGHVGTDIIFYGDYTNSSVTFTTTNWNTRQSIFFYILADADTEDDQITLQVTASGGGYNDIVKEFNVVITDRFSTPEILAEVPTFEERVAYANYARLLIPPTENVTLTLSIKESVLRLNRSTVIFTPQNWWRNQSFVVSPEIDDNSVEDMVTMTFTASGGNYDGLTRTFTTKVIDRDVITNYPEKINTLDPFSVTFTFAESVTDYFATDDVTVTGGTKGALSGSGRTYTMEITPTGGSDVVISVIKDAVFITGLREFPARAVTVTVIWDATAPTLSISGVPDKINTTSPFTATFTFNESVTGFMASDVTVTGGTAGAFTGSGATYSLPITPSGNTNVTVSVDADVATDGLNMGPSAPQSLTAVWDTAVPTLSISGIPDKINSRAEFTATFTFSESVNGFESNDVTVTGGTKGTFTGSGATYSLPISPLGNASVVVSVAANAATDDINTVPSNEQTGTAVWDATAPSVTISDVPEKINNRTAFTAT
ncbi:MAG: Ig-like domain-containing protein, partial [Bacteroidetes bacterium]|nr:Ig-like domain-containing protein [Bacteroidota bacterium]